MVLALAATIVACGGGGSTPASPTVSIQGAVDSAYGSSVQSVLSAWSAGAKQVTSGTFSVDVASDASHVLMAVDALGSPRSYSVWIPGTTSVSFSADSTAQALIFESPKIYTRDPAKALTALTEIHNLSTFPAFLSLLKGQESTSLLTLLGTTSVRTALRNCLDEWFAAHPSNVRQPKTIIQDTFTDDSLILLTYDGSNPAQTKVQFKNSDFRFLEIVEKGYNADGSPSAPKLLPDLLGGASPINFTNLIFGQIGQPSFQNTSVNMSSSGFKRVEYWFRGVGHLPPSMSVPQDVQNVFDTTHKVDVALIESVFWYVLMPIIDSIGGFADYLHYSATWTDLLSALSTNASVKSDLSDLISALQGSDIHAIELAGINLATDLFKAFEDGDRLKNLVIDYYKSKGLSASLALAAETTFHLAMLADLTAELTLNGEQISHVISDWLVLHQVNMASLKVAGSGDGKYDVVDLGTGKIPEHINNNGVILALGSNQTDTYTWANGAWVLVQSNFRGVGINDAGVIVGIVPPQHPAILSGGVLTQLPVNGFSGVYPTAINLNGDIAAIIEFNGGNDQVGVYRGGVLTKLGGFSSTPANLVSGRTWSINSSGVLAGSSNWLNSNGFVSSHGATWGLDNVISELDPGMNINSFAASINDNGNCCGIISTPNGGRAMISSGTLITQLEIPGVEPSGSSGAECINNKNQVVGEATPTSGPGFVFLWTPTGVTNLQQAIPSNSGWLLGQAISINDKGEIVGTGTLNGISHTFLLKPHG